MRFKAGAGKVGGRTLPIRKGWVGGRTRFGTRTTGSTWANEANPVAHYIYMLLLLAIIGYIISMVT